ncbi:family 3 encapsulin nanocompartment shell protein [Micromonospora sp. WMMD729]|uniref:family 3 encapsulin nanocompartment shell protein n=1 Tax=Micromonospora sp. WMMD729 TaxID=3404127 RepID=UPI003BF54906
MQHALADYDLTEHGPGEQFARAVLAAEGGDVDVPIAASLPTLFPLAKHRPRYTVRHLLKSATVSEEPVSYVSEAPTPGTPEIAGTSYRASPEATFVPRLVETKLTEVTAAVAVPPELLRDPTLLAGFVDYRVLVRLGTIENEVLLHGSADGVIPGLIGLPGARRRAAPGELTAEVITAAGEVEEMGGSCDAIVAHPNRYWDLLGSGMLARLGEVGIRVSRTRMIAPDQVLLGDFRAAVTLLESGTSQLTLRRGVGPDGADVISAGLRLGLAVHLPQHFLLLDLR